jgi:hypothetical protein
MQMLLQPIEHFNTPLSVSFTGIHSNEVEKFWPKAGPLIRLGLAEGATLEHVFFNLVTRKNQLWAAFRGNDIVAACVTELVTIGERDVCNVITCGGSRMDEWLDIALTTIEAWAKANGHADMRFPEVRLGWKRILKKHGYKLTRINLEKVYDHGK